MNVWARVIGPGFGVSFRLVLHEVIVTVTETGSLTVVFFDSTCVSFGIDSLRLRLCSRLRGAYGDDSIFSSVGLTVRRRCLRAFSSHDAAHGFCFDVCESTAPRIACAYFLHCHDLLVPVLMRFAPPHH